MTFEYTKRRTDDPISIHTPQEQQPQPAKISIHTRDNGQPVQPNTISIHTPRAGGDMRLGKNGNAKCAFQSTPHAHKHFSRLVAISIHTPRAGGDLTT